MLEKILMFFILTIVLICILISIKHFKEIKTLTNNINGTLYYNDYSNGNEAYSFNFSTSEIEKIYLDDNYEILDYLISSNGYYCIVREQQNNDCFKTFYLQHIDNSDKSLYLILQVNCPFLITVFFFFPIIILQQVHSLYPIMHWILIR